MPRLARIDAVGMFHHVIVRGVDRRKIFLDDRDKLDFLGRLEHLCEEHGALVYAWVLMDNHFHLAIRTGHQPLKKTMSGLLTGYALRFNRVNKRSGHLFQNRYKSIVVDEEAYFLSLVRYIHLNPVRAKMVAGVEQLETYPWTGHMSLMGKAKYKFMDEDFVLGQFAKRAHTARKHLVNFMSEKEAKLDNKVFTGGGLVRSAGGLQNLKNNDAKSSSDERILGDSSFVDTILQAAKDQHLNVPILNDEEKWNYFNLIAKSLCEQFEVTQAELYGASRRRPVSDVRRLLAWAGQKKLGLSGTEIAVHLTVSPQGLLRSSKKVEQEWESLDWITEGIV